MALHTFDLCVWSALVRHIFRFHRRVADGPTERVGLHVMDPAVCRDGDDKNVYEGQYENGDDNRALLRVAQIEHGPVVHDPWRLPPGSTYTDWNQQQPGKKRRRNHGEQNQPDLGICQITEQIERQQYDKNPCRRRRDDNPDKRNRIADGGGQVDR